MLSAFLLAAAVSLPAQQKGASISFDKTVHDFGKIMEADGIALCQFGFTNTGNIPLVITRVVASCGCTTPEWTREPIPPGGKGFVKASYNPRNRPGKFDKTITVMTNAPNPNTVLRIQGDVVPRELTVEDIYPYSMEQVRLKSNHIPFVKVFKGQEKTLLAEMINVSQEPVTIGFGKIPPHLRFVSPGTLKPQEKGIIEISYDAGKHNDWGFVIDRVELLLNGKSTANSRLTISATIEEDFSSLSPQEIAKAPVIAFKETTFDFGNMKQRNTVEYDFVFTNNGKSDLLIRKINASCGCTAVKPKDNLVKPGESSSIKAVFNSGTFQGRQNKSITVITNDPKNPQVILRVTGNVQPPGTN